MNYYEIKINKNNDPIPVVNGVHLHSFFNPQKEALGFIDKHKAKIENAKSILIMGLGFGYHIDAIINNTSNKAQQIIVIEPNTKLVQDFISLKGFKSQSIKIVSPLDEKDLFENEGFIDFLRTSPVILKHDLSFELYGKYFSNILSYKANTKISSYKHLLRDSVDINFTQDNELSIDTILKEIKSKTGATCKSDFALLALESLI